MRLAPRQLGRSFLRMEVSPEVRERVQAHEVFMPALSSTMTEGKVVQWLKKVGDRIEKGDVILVVESDKADMDVEAFDEGYLAHILTKEGETAAVGATIGLIAKNVEDIEAIQACGLDCIVDGSGSRHDGTTAVEPSDAAPAPSTHQRESAAERSAGFGGRDAMVTAPAAAAPLVPKPAGTVEVFLPALSSTMTEGKIVEWTKNIGDEVKSGDVIMVVESDKADMDVESFETGFLAHIELEAGISAPVGAVAGYLARDKASVPLVQAWAKSAARELDQAPGESSAAVRSTAPGSESAPVTTPEHVAISTPTPTPTSTEIQEDDLAPGGESMTAPTGRVIASPYAKRLAKENKIDLRTLRGRGPGGRILAADVQAAMLARSAAQTPSVASEKPLQASAVSGRMIATPGAKKLAKSRGVDLAKVRGTGPYGRITEADVKRALGEASSDSQTSAPTASAEAAVTSERRSTGSDAGAETERKARRGASSADAAPATEKAALSGPVPMSTMQKAVVNNMNASLQVPVFRVSYSITTDAVDALLSKLKSKGVTMTTLLAKALGLTLRKHPLLNARFEEPYTIVYQPGANIAVAVALPDGGLITPVLRDCADTDIYELSRRWRSLVRLALEKKLKPEDYQSGTFSLSNLGMFGVSSFDAILPKGTGAILAVAASQPQVRLQSNGLIGVSKVMQVTITCDHRHIYGAQAAEFLRDLADLLEKRVEELLL
jgi:pyruvate dehydrogenase E2 component (dihydrolipoamide acetyltransferase)